MFQWDYQARLSDDIIWHSYTKLTELFRWASLKVKTWKLNTLKSGLVQVYKQGEKIKDNLESGSTDWRQNKSRQNLTQEKEFKFIFNIK